MTTDPYSDEVRRRFSEPRFAGRATGEPIVARTETPDQRIELTAALDGDIIAELRFLAWGCPHTLAACDLFCSEFEGQALGELENVDISQIMRNLSVPVEKTGRILALEDTVRALITAARHKLGK